MVLLVIRFIKGITAPLMVHIEVTYYWSYWSIGRTFITNSYIIGKICFKLHLSLNLLAFTSKILVVFFFFMIVPQPKSYWSQEVLPYWNSLQACTLDGRYNKLLFTHATLTQFCCSFHLECNSSRCNYKH